MLTYTKQFVTTQWKGGAGMREYLVDYRKKSDFSQHYVAKRLGISSQYYQMIENGTRQKNMNITLVSKLSDVFCVPMQEIINQEQQWKSGEQLC